MIMIEGSAFIGFVFMITLPIYSIYSLLKLPTPIRCVEP